MITEARKIRLRRAIRYLYDLQQLRISTGNRDTTTRAILDPGDLEFMSAQAARLKTLELEAEKEVKTILKGIPIWEKWLKRQKGIGPRLGAVLLAEFDITKCPTVSSMWRYAGLGVMSDGHGDRRKKGEKAKYNPWLKAKMTKILGDCMLKANSPWREHYDNYKHRKQSMRVPCALCDETGTYDKKPCTNCSGTGTGPWGRSDAHRHVASIRYMVKMFLLEFYVTWRTMEGLPVRPPYQEQYLGHVHHADSAPAPT